MKKGFFPTIKALKNFPERSAAGKVPNFSLKSGKIAKDGAFLLFDKTFAFPILCLYMYMYSVERFYYLFRIVVRRNYVRFWRLNLTMGIKGKLTTRDIGIRPALNYLQSNHCCLV